MASNTVSLRKSPNLKKEDLEKVNLKSFLENDFDNMIKYSDWKKGEILKDLIKKCIK
jgi:hypothetical protein